MSESGAQMPRRLSQKSNSVCVGRIQNCPGIVQQEVDPASSSTPRSAPNWRGLTPAQPAKASTPRTRRETVPGWRVRRSRRMEVTSRTSHGADDLVRGTRGELRELGDLLASRRLVTLTGVGGSGKTRLALEAARRVAERHRDGVRLVELAGLGSDALVPRPCSAPRHARADGGAVGDRVPVRRAGRP
jgi:hypothetical protein